MKSILYNAFLISFLAVPVHATSLSGMKAEVSLPSNVVSFIAAKEQQADGIALRNGFTMPPDSKDYFAAAKSGHALEARRIYSGLLKDTNSPAYRTPLKQPALDAELALEAFASADPALVQSLGDDFMKSLPAGCIYFGGTDAGRGLPTLKCQSPGDPIFVLSQNAFMDGRYMEYIREMYGSKIQLPATNEVKEIIAATTAAGKTGFNAYAAGCGQIIKSIIAKNPDREFYYEQSFPIDDLSSNLSPHGLVMKISRQPLDAISANDIKATEDFWRTRIVQLTNNPILADKNYVRAVYAGERSAIASLYARRAQAATNPALRQQLGDVAQQAFNQTLAMDPSLPETVLSYAMFETMVLGKPENALVVAQKASQTDPSNAQFKGLIAQLQQIISHK